MPESSVSFFDTKKIAPFATLIGVNTDSYLLQGESQVTRNFIEREFDDKVQCFLQFWVKLVDIAGRKIWIRKTRIINLMMILVIFLSLFVHKYI